MDKQQVLSRRFERLGEILPLCIEQLRGGDDSSGVGAFLGSVDDIESILNICECMEDPDILAMLEVPLEKIHQAVDNQDLAGLTDVLEFAVYPLVKRWLEGMKEV